MNTISPIFNNQYIYSKSKVSSPNFKGLEKVETLTHTNIGSCLEGYIGKVRVRKPDGGESYLDVFKKYLCNNYENYSIKDKAGNILGEMNMTVNKYGGYKYDPYLNPVDPSHVFVADLRNYSNPNTPFRRKGLEPHKDIGTRLLQIAQRRSDEEMCQGNIKLISKNESKGWYKNVIGMVEEFAAAPNYGFKFNIHNPNSMILPPHSKEPLSRLQGGL